MRLSSRPWSKASIKVHAGGDERGGGVSVHCIKTSQESKGCQGAETEPWKMGQQKLIKSAECLTCCQPHPICHPRNCHLLVVGTSHTLIVSYYGFLLHYCSLYNSVPVDLVQTIKDSCHLCEEFCANLLTLNQITWTADKVLRRWGSWFCTGRNPPDSESWQSTRNWIIPSLGKWRI